MSEPTLLFETSFTYADILGWGGCTGCTVEEMLIDKAYSQWLDHHFETWEHQTAQAVVSVGESAYIVYFYPITEGS